MPWPASISNQIAAHDWTEAIASFFRAANERIDLMATTRQPIEPKFLYSDNTKDRYPTAASMTEPQHSGNTSLFNNFCSSGSESIYRVPYNWAIKASSPSVLDSDYIGASGPITGGDFIFFTDTFGGSRLTVGDIKSSLSVGSWFFLANSGLWDIRSGIVLGRTSLFDGDKWPLMRDFFNLLVYAERQPGTTYEDWRSSLTDQ